MPDYIKLENVLKGTSDYVSNLFNSELTNINKLTFEYSTVESAAVSQVGVPSVSTSESNNIRYTVKTDYTTNSGKFGGSKRVTTTTKTFIGSKLEDYKSMPRDYTSRLMLPLYPDDADEVYTLKCLLLYLYGAKDVSDHVSRDMVFAILLGIANTFVVIGSVAIVLVSLLRPNKPQILSTAMAAGGFVLSLAGCVLCWVYVGKLASFSSNKSYAKYNNSSSLGIILGIGLPAFILSLGLDVGSLFVDF